MSRRHTSAGSLKHTWAILFALVVVTGCSDHSSPVSPTSTGSDARTAALMVSGYVYRQASDVGEPPIADVLITLRDDQGAERTTTTDRRGFYSVRATAGEVVVIAAKDGYNPRESRFEVTDSTVLNFGLEPVAE
jgi:hypothetical protein